MGGGNFSQCLFMQLVFMVWDAEVSGVSSIGGVSTGEPDIVSLVIMSSQRTMNIYGSG